MQVVETLSAWEALSPEFSMKPLSSIFLLGALAVTTHADVHVYDFLLVPSEVVPPVSSPASGTAHVVLDDVTRVVQLDGTYSGLTGDLSLAALHGPAPVGSGGDHVFSMSASGGTSGTFSGQTTLDATQVSEMLGGLFYIDLHTDTFGGGELRGQLLKTVEPYCAATPRNCTACPCSNDAPSGTQGGCLNSAGRSARLLGSGLPSGSQDGLRFELRDATANTFALLASADNALPTSPANPCPQGSGVIGNLLDGLRCIGTNLVRHGTRATDSNGDVGLTNPAWGGGDNPPAGLLAQGGFGVGQTRRFQVFYREDPGLSCGMGQNTSDAAHVTVLP